MKKLLPLLSLMLLMACNEKEPQGPVVFSGSVENNSAPVAVITGNDLEQKMPIDAEGNFTDTLDIDKAGYYNFIVGRERTQVYLSPGDALSVSLDTKEFDETLTYTGTGAQANNYIAAKFLQRELETPMNEVYSMNEADFLKSINASHDAATNLLNATEGLSETFKATELKELEYGRLTSIENFQEYHRYFGSDKTFSVSEGFYDLVKDTNFADTTAYRNSEGYQYLLRAHFSRLNNQAAAKADREFSKSLSYVSLVNDNLPNGYAKDQLLGSFFDFGLVPDKQLDQVWSIYTASNPSPENLAKNQAKYQVYRQIIPGMDSPDFDYENHKGGTTALADLKGKYVYVDVWATWCGPCIREIPSLKALEHDYEDKNIAFVSMSIDRQKDHEKWVNMVNDKELGGEQLFTDKDWSSDFVKSYGVTGIPRFILIDPDGKIVSPDAPRPSNPELRVMLNERI